VPLSDEENRLLAQMEQALAAEDPRFVATLRGRRIERATKIRAGIAVLGAVIGLAMVLGAAMSQQTWLGVVGFVVMVTATTISLASWRGTQAAKESAGADNIITDGFTKPRRQDGESPF